MVLQADGGGSTRFTVPVVAGVASRDQSAELWRDGGVWLLPILVIVVALGFRRGWLWLLVLCVFGLHWLKPEWQTMLLEQYAAKRDAPPVLWLDQLLRAVQQWITK